MEQIQQKLNLQKSIAGTGEATSKKKKSAKQPKAESPAQVHLRHLLRGDPLFQAFRDDWVENYTGASRQSRYEIDFALPALKIGIEVDGWQYHGKFKEAFLRDREKDFEIKTNGWVLLRLQAGLLLNHRKLSEPSSRIQQFLECWVPRQQLIIKHLES
ncbi:MAG: hypothetical protein IBX50_12105 [Marinospirillum sp.]|uniref:hypothetical protein n=1 Tax=Marinospirillum sp. TaxID=2183934 RepID=UPI0019EA0C65|nr:hypothetical protein [Marinospirillum sp.]MBE0507439.1 hypothetical protein [Marinospirillum sp.]